MKKILKKACKAAASAALTATKVTVNSILSLKRR